ncbi:hypothetical protein [Bacillus massiliglaciei]|uniref:hypothetical protein n=1 Tax=Bacillus massiliglaciei TaxID=1816693 RepID=UPI000DA621BF|nr:hypothetical protein [Bacillus massiliglaciei]
MESVNLSLEELIFCFYSEGLFEQGLGLKQMYFPEMPDEQLEFAFQAACRSLLAKEMVEFREKTYKLKEGYKSYIHAMHNASYTAQAAKLDLETGTEEQLSFHFTEDGTFMHQLLHDGQVHQITKLLTKSETVIPIRKFFGFQELLPESSPALFVMENEDFEKLLTGVTENELLIHQVLQQVNADSEASAFIEDLKARNGMMDSLTKMEYDEQNNPVLMDVTFIIPGAQKNWMVTGSGKNEFTLQEVNVKSLLSVVLEKESAM